MKPDRSGRSRADSFRDAFAGWGYILRSQRNAWIHSAITILVAAIGFWLKLRTLEWAVLVAAIGLVWVAELFNTGLETLVDLASPEIHPLAARAKDIAAAAVLTAAITAAVIGLLVFLPYIVGRFAP